MTDFETIYQKRGEIFVWAIINEWEKSQCIKGAETKSLEERWMHFIHMTNKCNDNRFSPNSAVAA